MKEFIRKHRDLLGASLLFSIIGIIFIVLFIYSKEGFSFALLSLLPISELRGSMPLGYFSFDWPLWIVYPAAVSLNALVSPLVFIFLDHLHPVFYKWGFYKRLFDKFITRSREKMQEKVSRYGMLGIMLFVGIPLPITGAYTGTAGAWILGLNRKKTILAALGGVIISGLIVSSILILMSRVELSEGMEKVLEFFIKPPHAAGEAH